MKSVGAMYMNEKEITVMEIKGLLKGLNRMVSSIEFNLGFDNIDNLEVELGYLRNILDAIESKVNTDENQDKTKNKKDKIEWDYDLDAREL